MSAILRFGVYSVEPAEPCDPARASSLEIPGTLTFERRMLQMAKKSRGTRMAAAVKRAAKTPGGKGRVKNRKVGKKIMST
jgi:hypothetical protein